MIYQWHIVANVNDSRCEGDVLARNEEQAKQFWEDELADIAYGPSRFLSIEKTGMVLVHENQVKK